MDRSTLLSLIGSFELTHFDNSYELADEVDHGTFTAQEVSYTDCDGKPITALLLIPSHIDASIPHCWRSH